MMNFTNEALGNKKDKVARTDDEIKRDLDLQIARMDNDVSDFFEYQVDCIKKYLPFLEQVNTQSGFFDKQKKQAYYIKDNGHVLLRMNVDNKNSRKIVSLLHSCDIKIDALCGDVNFENNSSFLKFPIGFPQIIYGDLVISEYIRSLNNAPKYVEGDVYIIVPNNFTENDIHEYEKILGKNIIRKEKNIVKTKCQSIFNRKRIDESIHQISLLDLILV